MATVTGLTAQKIIDLDKVAVVGGSVQASGEILLNARGGDVINIGSVKAMIMESVYPIGTIYFSSSPTNPVATIGIGTWVAWGSGKVPVGVDTADVDFSSPDKVGGSKDVTLTNNELPSHNHSSAPHSHSINHDHDDATTDSNSHNHPVLVETLANNTTGGSQVRVSGVGGVGAGGADAYGNTQHSAHSHSVNIPAHSGSSGSTTPAGTGYSGSNTPFDILQPYITCYMWKRTS